MSSTTTQTAQAELNGFQGKLIGPSDTAYEQARRVYNAMIDKRPALIARCAGPDDVARAIRFAAEHSLLVAVRGGAHNGAGFGTCDDGVVIDLSPLRDIQVDLQARTVQVGGGCTWGEVDRTTNASGLATPSGIISTTVSAGSLSVAGSVILRVHAG
jgi:FAD/FMN-containing dehydrogenase